MFMTKSITAFRALLLVGTQLAGSIFASFLVKVLFPTEFKVRTTLSKDTSLVRGVFIEAVLTFELVFTVSSMKNQNF
jgi:aquaporin related protein